ncbi:MAG: DUF952 domain-containing protein [Novosphingobium sp.]|nr:DUF952 domain-containing protein [Novosphingobium sp.]
MSDPPTLAYKVLLGPQMAELEFTGEFGGSGADRADGYIHLSTRDQLEETVHKHFAGSDDLHVAAVDLDALGGAVKWEPARGGELFPHLYGTLPLSAVIAYGPLERDEHGRIRLPVAG